MTYSPVKCKEHDAFRGIAEAESDIARCLADFVCCILDEIRSDHKMPVEDKIELFKCLILAAAVKEKAIAAVLNALANIKLASKGICDSVNDSPEDD